MLLGAAVARIRSNLIQFAACGRPPAEYLRLDLRAHDLLRDVPLYDVSIVDLPGGGAGRHFLGRVFSWDHVQIGPEDSLLSRLSERDRGDSEIAPGTPVGSFLLLYQFPGEALSETRNATVHGYVCTALAPTAGGYRLYWGIYVISVSWLTRPYLIAIEPFRRILDPAMLRRIRRAWLVAYGAHGLACVARTNAGALGKDREDYVRSTPIAPGWPKQRGPIPHQFLGEVWVNERG